ncbi:hypothetical protein AL064_19090 [Pseudomonas syringae pv. syringae]|nr:hypothetical protein AL064_19090 [Pseudomonas syringae pv. syringae]KWS18422.1 hypothetical protein AL062_25535 [Pseudomonas syringae pv. syringae]
MGYSKTFVALSSASARGRLKRGLVTGLRILSVQALLTGNINWLAKQQVFGAMKAAYVSPVANHAIFALAAFAALMRSRHPDAQEVGKVVVALALIQVGVKIRALRCRWRRRHFGNGESFALFGREVENFALIAKRRGLATSHQPQRHQSFQVCRVVVAKARQ